MVNIAKEVKKKEKLTEQKVSANKEFLKLCDNILETCSENIRIEGPHNDNTSAYVHLDTETIAIIIRENLDVIVDLIKSEKE